jgi:sec-independent protein translocase protein TatA
LCKFKIKELIMGLSLPHILLLLVVVLVLFGAGKLPKVMGDMGKGIKAFKKGLSEEDKDQNKLENKDQ